jgi:hypothetical protein
MLSPCFSFIAVHRCSSLAKNVFFYFQEQRSGFDIPIQREDSSGVLIPSAIRKEKRKSASDEQRWTAIKNNADSRLNDVVRKRLFAEDAEKRQRIAENNDFHLFSAILSDPQRLRVESLGAITKTLRMIRNSLSFSSPAFPVLA